MESESEEEDCVLCFIWVLTSLSTGHITTGSFIDRGNQYIQLLKVLYCKLPTGATVAEW